MQGVEDKMKREGIEMETIWFEVRFSVDGARARRNYASRSDKSERHGS